MTDIPPTGDRIAKVMARAGVASRRDAERLILEGRVAVNGATVTSPALDVLPQDRVTLDGKPIDAPQPARLWLYYKPLGLVTSEHDEKGRQTVFESLPDGMPRVMSVGRLDLNSEGLLLLTNDGGLKRRLELPSTGWLRKYRVRVNGRPNEATFDPLRRGITIEGEAFLPMDIILDRQKGANAWLTVGLREGKNREIRRAMAEVGLTVNRLIRVSYGPFRLNEMQPGDVIEVKQKILKEQLGDKPHRTADESPERRPHRSAAGSHGAGRSGDKPRAERDGRKQFRAGAPLSSAPIDATERPPRKPRAVKSATGPAHDRTTGRNRPDRPEGRSGQPYKGRPDGARPGKPAPARERPEGTRPDRDRQDNGGGQRSGAGKTAGRQWQPRSGADRADDRPQAQSRGGDARPPRTGARRDARHDETFNDRREGPYEKPGRGPSGERKPRYGAPAKTGERPRRSGAADQAEGRPPSARDRARDGKGGGSGADTARAHGKRTPAKGPDRRPGESPPRSGGGAGGGRPGRPPHGAKGGPRKK